VHQLPLLRIAAACAFLRLPNSHLLKVPSLCTVRHGFAGNGGYELGATQKCLYFGCIFVIPTFSLFNSVATVVALEYHSGPVQSAATCHHGTNISIIDALCRSADSRLTVGPTTVGCHSEGALFPSPCCGCSWCVHSSTSIPLLSTMGTAGSPFTSTTSTPIPIAVGLAPRTTRLLARPLSKRCLHFMVEESTFPSFCSKRQKNVCASGGV
jgi:hypothetical protein